MGTHSFSRRGFTLIELLLVIGIIAILASIVIVAINPTRQLGQARDAQRRSDVNTILNAVYQYSIDNNGRFPQLLSGSSVTTGSWTICKANDSTCKAIVTGPATAHINLSVLTGSYLTNLPADPQSTTGSTRYVIQKANGRITVCAPNDEVAGADICVTR